MSVPIRGATARANRSAKRLAWWAFSGALIGVFALASCRDRSSQASDAALLGSRSAPVGRQTVSDRAANEERPLASSGPGHASRQPGRGSESVTAAPADESEKRGRQSTRWPELREPELPRSFCTERVHTLDTEACFALPPKRTRELLIYLHGIVPPVPDSPQKRNLDQVVAEGAERAGVVALLPRGKQGFAPKAYPNWWGWPTSKAAYARYAREFISKIEAEREKLEAVLDTRFERVFLAGSSSGAYFVAAVALHGDMPEVAGFGVLSGGAWYPTEGFEALPPRPVYVGYGKHDSVAASASALAKHFASAGWPVEAAPHAVGHGAREVYLDEAFALWRHPETRARGKR